MLCCGWVSAQSYHIGDLYTAPDGSQGIVYYIHPDGSGWVVALNDASTGCAWGNAIDVPNLTNQNPIFYQPLLNDTAGYTNTQIIRTYQNSNSIYAAGVVDFAHGWVLPSPAQLSMLYGQLPFVSTALTRAGGTELARDFYWCSGERDANNAWRVHFALGYFNYTNKTTFCRVRAVRSFSATTVVYDTTLTYLWNTGSTQPHIDVSPGQTTTYTVTATTEFGCSNTAEQTILVGNNAPQVLYDTVCQGAGYEANGFTLTPAETGTAGTLTRSREMTTGNCSSTITLQLTVTPTATVQIEAAACETYEWNGVTYDESGDYTQTFTSSGGCDSVVTLHLTVNHGTHNVTDTTVCERFTWTDGTGETYTVSGTYTFDYINGDGCPSTDTLHLIVNLGTHNVTDTTVCERFTWTDGTGETYTETGTYTFDYTNGDGCPSTDTLHLTIATLPAFFIMASTDTICIGDSVTLQTIENASIQWLDDFGTVIGAEPTITVMPASPTNYYVTVFYGNNNSNLIENGDFEQGNTGFSSDYYNAQTSLGTGGYSINTDVYNLWGNAHQYGYGNEGQYMIVDGANYANAIVWRQSVNVTPNTTYSFSLMAVSIGDINYSTANLQVMANGVPLGYTLNLPAVLNQWQYFEAEWNSTDNTTLTLTIFDLNTSGLGNDFGIDNIQLTRVTSPCSVTDSIHIDVFPTHTVDIGDTICDNELPFVWNGITYTESGDYTQTFTNSYGCDSVVTLHLTVNLGTHNVTDTTVCESFTWADGNGDTYTESGTYTFDYTNGDGCPSTDTLHLTVNHTIHDAYTVTANDTYTWTNGNGETYNTSGIYTYTHTDDNGCTQVDTLHLTIHYSSSNEFSVVACERYEWDGVTYTESGDYVREYSDIYGADSTMTLHLTVNNPVHTAITVVECASYTWADGDGQTQTESGTFTYVHDDDNGCTQVDTLHLTIHHSVEESFETTICKQSLPYHWNGLTFTEDGTQSLFLTTSHGCDSTVRLTLNSIDDDIQIVMLTEDPCADFSAELLAQTEMTEFQWSTGDITPQITALHPGTYYVTASEGNCIANASFFVPVCEFVLYLPNAITATAVNGINDYFFIPQYSQRQIQDFEIHIYNRWGQLVFHSEDKNFKWDGSSNGKIFANTTYTYVILCTNYLGKQFLFKGSITVL